MKSQLCTPSIPDAAEARPIAFIGIDPGASGCAAIISDSGHDLFDWPGDPALVVPRLKDWLAQFDMRLAALATARRLFPGADLGRKKHHGRADALLLAWWARRQMVTTR